MPSGSDVQLNFLQNMDVSSIGTALLIFFLAVLVVGLIAGAIALTLRKKQFKYKIPLYKKLGGSVVKVTEYKGKDYNISRAGDKLLYVAGAKKYIPIPTKQSAPNEYPHFEREDGEWINFEIPDINEKMREAKVKFVHQDMRSQRVAISDLLEQRFKGKKSWWEKYGHLVTHTIFYLIVCICIVVVFYQWGEIITKTGNLLDKVIELNEKLDKSNSGVVPTESFAPLLFLGFNNLKNKFKSRFRKK